MKKIIVLIIVLFLIVFSCEKQEQPSIQNNQRLINDVQEQDLFPVYKDGKIKYINTSGEIVLDTNYDKGYDFYLGRAIVKKGDLCGLIDFTGKEIIGFASDYYDYYTNDYVILMDSKQDYYVYDINGNAQFKDEHYNLYSLPDNLFTINDKNENYRIMNIKEEILYQSDDRISDYSEGMVLHVRNPTSNPEFWFINIETGDKYGIYEYALPFSEGLAAVEENYQLFFIDRNGNKIINGEESGANLGKGGPYMFSEGMCVVYGGKNEDNEDLYGYINKKGELVIPFNNYHYASQFSEDYAYITVDYNKIGFMKKNGEWLIEPKYYSVTTFKNGLAKVKFAEDEEWSYIDKQGNIIWQGEKKAN